MLLGRRSIGAKRNQYPPSSMHSMIDEVSCTLEPRSFWNDLLLDWTGDWNKSWNEPRDPASYIQRNNISLDNRPDKATYQVVTTTSQVHVASLHASRPHTHNLDYIITITS